MSSVVQAQVVRVETDEQEELLIVIHIACTHCATRVLTFAAHHASAVLTALQQAIDHLPPEATEDGVEVTLRRPFDPENN